MISIYQETCTGYKFHILIIMSAECEHWSDDTYYALYYLSIKSKWLSLRTTSDCS